MSEQLAEQVANKWLSHLGYTPEEIAEGQKPNHSHCDFDGMNWDCLDEDGNSHHELQDNVCDQIQTVMTILEFAEPEILRTLREELNEMNHGQYGRDGETCPAQRFLDDENAGDVDWDYCECPLAQVNALIEKADGEG